MTPLAIIAFRRRAVNSMRAMAMELRTLDEPIDEMGEGEILDGERAVLRGLVAFLDLAEREWERGTSLYLHGQTDRIREKAT